jgi:hypothetical protein
MTQKSRKYLPTVAILVVLLLTACKSTQLSEAAIEHCLIRTDFAGMNIHERHSIAWLIAYERKVRETTCCAIEPRSSVLAKRNHIAELKSEALSRIDILEAGGDSAARANLRRNDACYAALMDLYHDVNAAQRRR